MSMRLGDSAERRSHDVTSTGIRFGKVRVEETASSPPTVKVAAQPRWAVRYRAAVIVSDVTAVSVVAGSNLALGYGSVVAQFPGAPLPTATLTVVLALMALRISRAWDPVVLGTGSAEFHRLLRAFATTGVTLALLGLAVLESAFRPWVFGVVPVAACLAALGRYGLRKALHTLRATGSCVEDVLAVGEPDALAGFVQRTRRDKHAGWAVTGICTPTATGPDGARDVAGVPVVGDLDAVTTEARSGRYRIVAVGPTPGWSSVRLHRLAWELEGSGVDLVVDPGLMEIAGPRLHISPVDGFPLLRLSQPDFAGSHRLVKHLMDKVGAAALLLLVAPVMLVVAIVIRLDGGPVFFRQTRIGYNGRPFSMVKFRSMVTGAHTMRDHLTEHDAGAGPLFKIREDPRVTRVGTVLRRYSLDELPQLFNVLAGTMTLVGPRPPLPEEVATYGQDARRRLLVRPGLTGLWQVSGRSDLTWEESVRLDLRYVENWTLALDAMILWKTLGAVRRGRGAY